MPQLGQAFQKSASINLPLLQEAFLAWLDFMSPHHSAFAHSISLTHKEQPVSILHRLLLCSCVYPHLLEALKGAVCKNSWSQGLVFMQGPSLVAGEEKGMFSAELWQPRPPHTNEEVCQLLLLSCPHFIPETDPSPFPGGGKGPVL